MKKEQIKREKRVRRHNSVTSSITTSADRPRLAVFRAHQHIYAQVIDDTTHKTIVAASSLDLKTKGKKMDIATEVGSAIAKKALDAKISKVVFDRGGYKYHGRVKALAEAARSAGLEF